MFIMPPFSHSVKVGVELEACTLPKRIKANITRIPTNLVLRKGMGTPFMFYITLVSKLIKSICSPTAFEKSLINTSTSNMSIAGMTKSPANINPT